MTSRLLTGDCRDILPTLPERSVHCVVTSPPYFGLRDYQVAGQIGMEPTPAEYVAELVAVFREVWRVLRDDGVCFLNLGDSYSAGGQGAGSGKQLTNVGAAMPPRKAPDGFKPKDLMMIPARVAIALQDAGWYLRSDIIWAKPNPMPESVTDRPTSAHEHVFLLTKQPRYFYDADAVRETDTGQDHRRSVVEAIDTSDGYLGPHKGIRTADGRNGSGRNLRNVWQIATAPFAEAHFATFPPELVERCIKAGTSEKGCCASCQASWTRQTKVTYDNPGNRTTNGPRSLDQRHETAGFAVRLEKRTQTLGWQPRCSCPIADPVPCTILDPFAGAGTTLMVADRLQRNAIGIELNPAYNTMTTDRIHKDAGLFAEFTT